MKSVSKDEGKEKTSNIILVEQWDFLPLRPLYKHPKPLLL